MAGLLNLMPATCRVTATQTHGRKASGSRRYRQNLESAVQVSHLLLDYHALFLDVVDDSANFETELAVHGITRHGYRILEVHGPVVPSTIAAVLLHIRDVTRRPWVPLG